MAGLERRRGVCTALLLEVVPFVFEPRCEMLRYC